MQSCKKHAPIQNEPTVDAGILDESGVREIPPEAREVLKALDAQRTKPGLKIKTEPQNRPMRPLPYEVCPRMLEAHLTLVHQVVAPIARRMPANVQRDDLFAAGVFGLAESLRKNGGDGGTTFEWYARMRIRGAVLDELRAQDWLKRRARDAVNAAAQRDDGETEAVLFVGLDELSSVDEEEFLASFETNPAAAYESKETGRILANALDKLPDRERKVIGMYYFDDAKYKEIGAELGVSEPRVSQLHARALGRLRSAFMPKRFPRAVRSTLVEPNAPHDVHDAHGVHDEWSDVFSLNDSSSDVA